MLNNWLKSLSINDLNIDPNDLEIALQNITFYNKSSDDLTQIDLCILGIGSQSDSIRKFLYTYNEFPPGLRIMDLGNVRKKNLNSILPILKEISDSGLNLILIDADGVGPQLLFDHFNNQKEVFNPLLIDENFRTEESSFGLSFLNKKIYKCNNVSLIGSQIHKLNNQLSENYNRKSLRLGKLRTHKESIEALMRNGNFCYFNLNAIKKCDAPGKTGTNPSGLFSEEASQISRYAGLSEHLSTFMIGGFWHIESQTAELISQIIWYFIDGFSKRSNDIIEDDSSLQQYIVDIKEPSLSLTFVKSEKSGRWWFKVPIEINDQKGHKHVPCTYHDYQSACNEEVSDLVMDAIENQ